MALLLFILASFCFLAPAQDRDDKGSIRQAIAGQPGEWEGRLTVLVQDDLTSGRSETIRRIGVDGRDLELLWPDAPDTRCAPRVKVRGIRNGNRIVVQAGEQSAETSPCTVTGVQNVAVLLVNYKNTSLPPWFTVSTANSVFFEPGWSMEQFWRDNSFGATTAAGRVFGPFTLDEDYSCYQTDELRDAAIRAADPVVDFRNYTRLFIVAPNTDDCWWSGLSTVGCVPMVSAATGSFVASLTWIMAPTDGSRESMAKLIAHESGHGFGLNHARSLDYDSVALGAPGIDGTRNEYGDMFSNMGIGAGHWSAPQKSSLGWLSSPSGVLRLDAPGTFIISPFEKPNTGIQTLRIRRGPDNDQWLWLEYRQPLGIFDSTLPIAAFGGALIHYEDSLNPSGTYSNLLNFRASHRPNDFRLAPLPSRSTWRDLYSSLSLTLGDATADGLPVSVKYDSLCATLPSSGSTVGGEAQIGAISISAAAECSWTAVSGANWITITGGQSGSGSGSVSYTLGSNTTTGTRTGSLYVGRQRFVITQRSSLPALTLSLTHSGQFAPGATGTFTATIVNAGEISTPNTVAIRNDTGPGLSVSAMSGVGWTCSIADSICFRKDILPPGQSYSPVSVTVSVSADAPAKVNFQTSVFVLDDNGGSTVVATSSDGVMTTFGSDSRKQTREYLNRESPEPARRSDRPTDR